MRLSVVIPAYRETENLEILLPKIKENLNKKYLEQYEIIIVDALEKIDNTEEICIKNSVKYFHRENGNNYGDAIRTGINKAENDYILVMDADRFTFTRRNW